MPSSCIATCQTGTIGYPLQCAYLEANLRDFIPIHPGKYVPHKTWQETLANREEALRSRHMKEAERLSAHTRILPPLTDADCVRIQNRQGQFPLNGTKLFVNSISKWSELMDQAE
ncbi:hypothetical protein RRG08_027920 [Elysia crispata]|uniref:Uncharacterized protein n=1 Tax=Elysia crispata TaxID=231223 RepID=A0AAE1DTR1_9GAST|nr:hypothetical protein RRG08_027920 [Elysia crispata]